jgi:hypothetical protein
MPLDPHSKTSDGAIVGKLLGISTMTGDLVGAAVGREQLPKIPVEAQSQHFDIYTTPIVNKGTVSS